jgi:hypothetical protein
MGRERSSFVDVHLRTLLRCAMRGLRQASPPPPHIAKMYITTLKHNAMRNVYALSGYEYIFENNENENSIFRILHALDEKI